MVVFQYCSEFTLRGYPLLPLSYLMIPELLLMFFLSKVTLYFMRHTVVASSVSMDCLSVTVECRIIKEL